VLLIRNHDHEDMEWSSTRTICGIVDREKARTRQLTDPEVEVEVEVRSGETISIQARIQGEEGMRIDIVEVMTGEVGEKMAIERGDTIRSL
jgi:adenylyl- and sulfurtransferase ThiI